MGLTRTRFSQADTAVAKIQDPITVLNSGSTIANVDVGFLINRNHGTKSNVAVYWNETGTELTLGLTANTGVADGNIALTSYANLRAGTIYGNIGGGNSQANVYLTGSIIPTSNVAYDLGSTTNRFRSLWLSGSTMHIGGESMSVDQAGRWSFTTGGETIQLGNSAIFSDVTITGNLNLLGNTTQFDSNNLVVHDSIIQLHTPADLAPLTGDDGRDIGIDFHYYKTHDNHAFLGWANDTGQLEWYDSGYETSSNVFVGNTYGTIKTGVLVLANATVSTSSVTGALRVSGGAGVAGNLYVGTNLVVGSVNVISNLVTAATNINSLLLASTAQDANIGTITTSISTVNTNISTVNANVIAANASIQAIDANIGAYETYANASIQTLNANIGAYETYANASIQTLNANIGSLTNNLSNYSTVANAAAQQVQLDNMVSTANANALAYLTTTSATVVAATNSAKTQVTSNISSGTAYVTFVPATSGNVTQNINTALTYNPSSGNLTAYGLVTTTGLYWASNGVAFSSGITVSEINSANALSNISSSVTSIRFDRDTGIFVHELSPGNVRVRLGSSFKTWHVAGQTDLVAVGEDEMTFVGSGIDITTQPTDPKTITLTTNNSVISANLGAFQSYANASIGSIRTNLNTLDANVGAFHTYANLHFSDSNYGNTQVAEYLPVYNGTINATVAQSSQPNITDVGTLTGLDVSGTTTITGAVSLDGTGGGTPQYSVKIGNADGEKLGFVTRGTAGYGVSTEVLKDDESGYGKYNVVASEMHFNIVNGTAATVQNNAVVIQANGMVTLDAVTQATSTVTGALVVRGGAGIAGNVYADTVYTTTGIRWAGNGVAFSSGGSGAGLTYTANTAPPTSGNISGDQWYNTSTDVLYEYVNDGTTKYWVDIQSQTIAATTTPPVSTTDTLHPFLLAGM